MSWPELRVRDHKRKTDRAIHRAFVQLAADPLALETFYELLNLARERASRLFEAPFVDGNHLGVESLVHLARFHQSHHRPACNWPGSSASWRPIVSSLAHHLICNYTVPEFLTSSWYAIDAAAEKKRRWFVAHSRGASFRSLDLPVVMTRKMEHIFLSSPKHLPIEHAMRRAELLGLEIPRHFLRPIMNTRLLSDLSHGGFWRTFWNFLITNAEEIDPAQIGPMIDYIHAIRHDQIGFEPPHPNFSMKRRTVTSMLRQMRDWHRSLGVGGSSYSWGRLPLAPLAFEERSPEHPEEPRRWQLVELTNSAQLRNEGAALRHCVASYANRCYYGTSSIWSLRFWQRETIHHVLTVEVDPKRRAIVQVRGKANRMPSGKPLRLLQDWAAREKLQMAI